MKIKDKIEKISKDRRVLVLAIILMVTFSGVFTILLVHPGNSGNGGGHYVQPPVSQTSTPKIIISASQNPVDSNMTVTFNASPNLTDAAYTYKYCVYEPGHVIIDYGYTDTFSFKFGIAGTYSIVWEYTSYYVGNATYNETVHRDPIISVSPSTSTTEPGKPVAFTPTVEYGISPYYYSWYVRIPGATTFNKVSTAANPSLYFNSTGKYCVYATAKDSLGYFASALHTFGDTNSSSYIPIYVYPPPLVSISASHNPADIGVPIQFNATPSGGSGSYAYSYTLYDGQSSSSSTLLSGSTSSFSFSFFTQGNYLLSWEITSSTLTANSSIIESVNTDPTISINENKTTTDAGNPISFSTSEQGGTSPYYYSWYARASNVSNYSLMSTNANPSLFFDSSGTYFVYASLRDGSGYHVNSSIVSITVNPSLSGSISLSPSILPVPYTDVGSVSISGGSGVSQNNICWTNGFFQAIGTPTLPYTFSAGTHLIAVTITDSAGSVLKLHTYLRVLPNNIKITPHVPSQVPQNSDIFLSADANSFIGPNITVTGYSWEINNKSFGGQTISFDFTESGIYHIFISAWGSYRGANDTNTSEVNITVLPPSSTPNIMIMPYRTNVTGGIDFSYWVSFHNNTSYSAAFLSFGGRTYQPSNMTMYSNGSVHISKHVVFSTLQVGTYQMSLEVINNQSQQKDSNATFSISLSQSGTFSIYSIAAFFGGYYNFLIFLATVASLAIAYVGIEGNKKPPVINISENGKQVKYQLSGKRIGKR